jgi:hypothetical protein
MDCDLCPYYDCKDGGCCRISCPYEEDDSE